MLGSVMCEYLGVQPKYVASMIVGGATPGAMVHHAAAAIRAGSCETVLIVAGENRKTGQSRNDAVQALTAVGHPHFENPYGLPLPGMYAMVAKRHMHEFGTTSEQLASVAVTARHHASMNPAAQMREPITIEDVLSSKMIAEPLHMLDCCLISDAAGALIVTSAERAKSLAKPPVYVRGIGEAHTHEHLMMAPSLTHTAARDSAAIAYEMAGVTPDEIDVAELYDCFTIVPIIELEEMGFVKPGEGGAFFEEGHARLGGRLPVNTHGGMMSHAHAGAAGGLFDFVEAARQLRGECGERQVPDAELALVHVEGGILSSHCTAILASTAMTPRGIVSYAGYVPRYRLDRPAIRAALGSGGGAGARSVASFDEDSTTMAVEACRRALNGDAPADLFLATSSPAYADKTNATAVHAALGLRREGLRRGSRSFRARRGRRVARGRGPRRRRGACRTSARACPDPPTSATAEMGRRRSSSARERAVIAEVVAEASITVEFLDRWREPGALASQTWEERLRRLAVRPAGARGGGSLPRGQQDSRRSTTSSSHHRTRASHEPRPNGAGAPRTPEPRETIGYAGAADVGLGLAAALDAASQARRILSSPRPTEPTPSSCARPRRSPGTPPRRGSMRPSTRPRQ